MLTTVSISLGFPLGYLVLNPLSEHLFENHEWQFVKRVYSCIALGCIILFSLFFTDKHVNIENTNEENGALIEVEIETIYPSNTYQIFTNIIWFLGLFTFGLAINAIVVNFVSFEV